MGTGNGSGNGNGRARKAATMAMPDLPECGGPELWSEFLKECRQDRISPSLGLAAAISGWLNSGELPGNGTFDPNGCGRDVILWGWARRVLRGQGLCLDGAGEPEASIAETEHAHRNAAMERLMNVLRAMPVETLESLSRDIGNPEGLEVAINDLPGDQRDLAVKAAIRAVIPFREAADRGEVEAAV